MRITVVDYGIGNLFSICAALKFCDIGFTVDIDGSKITKSEILLIPGVASFGNGILGLDQRNQLHLVQKHFQLGKKIVGFCLGAQMMMECSDEAPQVRGLGLVPGRVVALNSLLGNVPNQGWSKISKIQEDEFKFEDDYFYFSHKYKIQGSFEKEYSISESGRRENIIAFFQHQNLIGAQFHPELSGLAGLNLIRRILT